MHKQTRFPATVAHGVLKRLPALRLARGLYAMGLEGTSTETEAELWAALACGGKEATPSVLGSARSVALQRGIEALFGGNGGGSGGSGGGGGIAGGDDDMLSWLREALRSAGGYVEALDLANHGTLAGGTRRPSSV